MIIFGTRSVTTTLEKDIFIALIVIKGRRIDIKK